MPNSIRLKLLLEPDNKTVQELCTFVSKRQALQTILPDEDATTTAFNNVAPASSQMSDALNSIVNTNKELIRTPKEMGKQMQHMSSAFDRNQNIRGNRHLITIGAIREGISAHHSISPKQTIILSGVTIIIEGSIQATDIQGGDTIRFKDETEVISEMYSVITMVNLVTNELIAGINHNQNEEQTYHLTNIFLQKTN